MSFKRVVTGHAATRTPFRCRATRGEATVVKNRACSLDESVRLLTLSISDPVQYLEGRRMTPKPAQPRWLDAYQAPGQKVTVTVADAQFSATLASSPSTARKESANLDASIVELVVERGASNLVLFAAEPGNLVSVSDVRGIGFASPVDPEVTLTSVLEEKRPLLVIASGAQGIAAVRAALQWDPLQAMATECPVVVVFITHSRQSAAFMTEWDDWAAAGVTLVPVYICSGGGSYDGADIDQDAAAAGQPAGDGARGSMDGDEGGELLPEADRVILQLEPLFKPDGRIASLMQGRLPEAAALFAGLSASESKTILRHLSGMSRELILQC